MTKQDIIVLDVDDTSQSLRLKIKIQNATLDEEEHPAGSVFQLVSSQCGVEGCELVSVRLCKSASLRACSFARLRACESADPSLPRQGRPAGLAVQTEHPERVTATGQ